MLFSFTPVMLMRAWIITFSVSEKAQEAMHWHKSPYFHHAMFVWSDRDDCNSKSLIQVCYFPFLFCFLFPCSSVQEVNRDWQNWYTHRRDINNVGLRIEDCKLLNIDRILNAKREYKLHFYLHSFKLNLKSFIILVDRAFMVKLKG